FPIFSLVVSRMMEVRQPVRRVLRDCPGGPGSAPAGELPSFGRPPMKISGILLCACALAVAWAGAGSLVQQAPEKAARMANPRAGDPDAWRAGAKLYERECAECHGAQRQGGQKAP